MDVERALIAKCIEGHIDVVIARQIGPQHFENENNRAVFTTIVKHLTKYGSAPSREAVVLAHPGYQVDINTDSVDYIMDIFVKKVQRREAQASILDLAEAIEKAPAHTEFDSLFMQHTERVAQAIPTSRVSSLKDVRSRIERYQQQQRQGRLPGIPLGFPTLDQIVLGVQSHEMVVIGAPSNVGKSTILQYIALAAYLNGQNKADTPIFITLEMTGDALLRKFDTMANNFSYHALRALELGEGDMEKWETWGERCQNAPNDIHIIDDIGECTVEKVFAETLRWKPNAMFVDYFGLMTPSYFGGDKVHQGMANMAKALKRVPITTGVPVFTAAQTNRSGFREGVRADNVADTIEIFRSADIYIGLERDEEESPNEMLVKLVKTRDSGKGQVTIKSYFDTMEFGERESFGRKTVFTPNIVADTFGETGVVEESHVNADVAGQQLHGGSLQDNPFAGLALELQAGLTNNVFISTPIAGENNAS